MKQTKAWKASVLFTCTLKAEKGKHLVPNPGTKLQFDFHLFAAFPTRIVLKAYYEIEVIHMFK